MGACGSQQQPKQTTTSQPPAQQQPQSSTTAAAAPATVPLTTEPAKMQVNTTASNGAGSGSPAVSPRSRISVVVDHSHDDKSALEQITLQVENDSKLKTRNIHDEEKNLRDVKLGTDDVLYREVDVEPVSFRGYRGVGWDCCRVYLKTDAGKKTDPTVLNAIHTALQEISDDVLAANNPAPWNHIVRGKSGGEHLLQFAVAYYGDGEHTYLTAQKIG